MPPYQIEWLEEARTDIRRVDPPVAMRIFEGILHHARTGGGDVTTLHGEMAGSFRLRVGDYRILFTLDNDTLCIFGVRHRSQAYR